MAVIKVRIPAIDLQTAKREVLPILILTRLKDAGIPIKVKSSGIFDLQPEFEGVERGVLFTQGSVEPTCELIYIWTDEEEPPCLLTPTP